MLREGYCLLLNLSVDTQLHFYCLYWLVRLFSSVGNFNIRAFTDSCLRVLAREVSGALNEGFPRANGNLYACSKAGQVGNRRNVL